MIRYSRGTLAIAVALFLCMFLAVSGNAAQAASAEDARNTLKSSLDSVFAIMNDPQFKSDEHRNEMLDKIEGVVHTIFDYDEFSARTVGRNWKNFTPDQQKRFAGTFADLLRATYIERIRGYTGNGVTYAGERLSTKGDKVEVQTLLDYQGKSVPVDYRMVHKDSWVIYDVIVEGVSLVKNYRTQFQELLTDGGDAEMLIERVQKRAEEVRSQDAKKE